MNEMTDTAADENDFRVIDGKKQEDINNKHKCYRNALQSVEYLSTDEIFSGFNTIKAFTFSFDVGFIDYIMRYFDYAEIILGGNYLVQKNKDMQDLTAEVLANAKQAANAVQEYPRLVEMMKNEDIAFRTPCDVIDHRKIYLLRADDGRTRVISPSANMTRRAWGGGNHQLEDYNFDDTPCAYEEAEKDFETAWELAHAITMDVIACKKAEDPVDGNPILKGIKETGRTVVLQHVDSEINIDTVKYVIDHEKLRAEYAVLVKGLDKKAKNGLYEISPRSLETIKDNKRKADQKKIKCNQIEKPYPELTLDINNQEAFLDNEKIDLNPSEEEIRQDIDELLSIYGNFDQFVTSDVERFKAMHFKLMNAVFCSPFFATFRCASMIHGFSASSLPMFALVSSATSNSGKTFMLKAALKMMTGKVLDDKKASENNVDSLRAIQSNGKGIPVFIDEVNNPYISRIKSMIKNPEICENSMSESMPMIMFASNDVLNPEEPLRKRMLFFPMDGALPSTVDKTAYESRGRSMIKKLGTAFYRAYLRKLLPLAKYEMDMIVHSKNLPEDYYPDLTNLSSKAFLSVFSDYGYAIPSYMKELTWEKDYSSDSRTIDTIHEIETFYKENRKACTLTKKYLEIALGTDKNSTKMLSSWNNSLPRETKPDFHSTRDGCYLKIDRKEFEKHLGYRLSKYRFLGR